MTPSPHIAPETKRDTRSIATAQQQQRGWDAWPDTLKTVVSPAADGQRLLPPEFEGLLYGPAFEGDQGGIS
jgi:hypothetical protein